MEHGSIYLFFYVVVSIFKYYVRSIDRCIPQFYGIHKNNSCKGSHNDYLSVVGPNISATQQCFIRCEINILFQQSMTLTVFFMEVIRSLLA